MTDKELVARAREVERHVRSTLDTTVADLVRDLADALEARSVAYTELLADYEAMKARTENAGEWEYGTAHIEDPGVGALESSMHAAEVRAAAWNLSTGTCDGFVVKRRPAGPWIPVQGESKP